MTTRRATQESITFIANIPVQIEAEWDPRYAHLTGFPLNFVYKALRDADGQGQPRPAAARYWFDPGTHREDEQRREMLYVPREASPYHNRVTVRKDTGSWEIGKYRGRELVRAASGPNFRTAMLPATLTELEPDGPVSNLGKFV